MTKKMTRFPDKDFRCPYCYGFYEGDWYFKVHMKTRHNTSLQKCAEEVQKQTQEELTDIKNCDTCGTEDGQDCRYCIRDKDADVDKQLTDQWGIYRKLFKENK